MHRTAETFLWKAFLGKRLSLDLKILRSYKPCKDICPKADMKYKFKEEKRKETYV